jgi:hypothetical protein
MTSELVLAEMVRAWIDRQLPGDVRAANHAVAIAEAAYAGGASVSEACRQVRAFVGSWSRHPSHVRVAPDGRVPLAS